MRNICILLLLWSGFVSGQALSLKLVPSTLTNSPQVHSGAFGVYEGKWYCIGGRQNGLHGFQTPAAFPVSGINETIYFTDPAADQTWSASTVNLPVQIREAINSSNMQFYQQDSMLYMIGGYGWKDSIQNFITWPTLTAVNLEGLSNAVINNQPIAPHFRQIVDTSLAVCGAHLQKLDSVYYLVFGHLFDGYYDRTDTSGFHVQRYTHAIRKFQIIDDGVNLYIANYSEIKDTANFRRRDYNLIPQIFPGGELGLTAFSGVFLKGIDLPYLNCVDIDKTGYTMRNNFNQNLSQYHSAVCALYDSVKKAQHNIFFGGMSMYYRDTLSGIMLTDSQVPFVRTISEVLRDSANNLYEFDLNITFPALLGTNAYFFRDENAPVFAHEIIHLNALSGNQRIGYIIGGIESPELNINSTDPSMSFASPRVFEVFLDKDTISGASLIENKFLDFVCYPNPTSGSVNVEFELLRSSDAEVVVFSNDGRAVKRLLARGLVAGKQKLTLDISDLSAGIYSCMINVNGDKKAIRLKKK